MSAASARPAVLTWPAQLRTRLSAWKARRALLRQPLHCDGCDVDYVPWLTEAQCPVCREAAVGLNWVARERYGRPFALRFLWLFAVLALLLLAHALYSS